MQFQRRWTDVKGKRNDPNKIFKKIVEGVRTFFKVRGTSSVNKTKAEVDSNNPFDGIPLPRRRRE